MKNIELAKILFISTLILIIFSYGFVVGSYNVFPQKILKVIKDNVVQVYAERRTLTKAKPEGFLEPARYDGEGVTVNEVPGDRNELILLSGFFEESNELRLIRRDGTVVARWQVRFSEIFKDTSHLYRPPETDWNVDIHGALILPDGSVIFNFEYSGLVKLDRCGDVIWALSRETHHSVERAEGGGYWVPGRRHISSDSKSPFPPFRAPFNENILLKISEDGEILAEISVSKLFYDNGLEAILTANSIRFQGLGGPIGSEIVHLNKIVELTSDKDKKFPMFEAGDLAISLRDLNLIMVIDPDLGKVKWWRIGPWLRQHDPEFTSRGTIVVFNNNTFSADLAKYYTTTAPQVSNILEIDPATDNYEIIYGNRSGEEMLSITRGKLDLTPYGGVLITENESGRVFEMDNSGNIIWQYINRYNSDEIAQITEARMYPESYFQVSDWSCEG